MHALFLLLVDHVSKQNCENSLLFNFVLTSYKGILQKISVRGNPKFVSKNEIDRDSPQY